MASRSLTFKAANELLDAVIARSKSDRVNKSTFVRQSLEEKLARENGTERIDALEGRIASTNATLLREIRSLNNLYQSFFAYFDTFVFSYLTCIPAPADVSSKLAQAEARHEKMMKSVANRCNGKLALPVTEKKEKAK